jgi:mono/diheme cytochrome c family protein
MPAHQFLNDEEVAAVASYIRKKFNDINEPVKPEEVSAMRKNIVKK